MTNNTNSEEINLDQKATEIQISIDYIKDGEPLSGYKSENDVGVLNRTAKQLFSIIEFLKLEIRDLKVQRIVTNNETVTENRENPIDTLNEQLQTLTRVSGQKFSEQDSKIHKIQEDLSAIKKQRPTNFLDYSQVRSLEQLVAQLESRIEDLRINASKNSSEAIQGTLNEEALLPYKAELRLLDQRIRAVLDDIGVYDSESNTGQGLKNRVQQLFNLATETKRLFDSQILTLSPAQEEKTRDLIELEISGTKVKVAQQHQIALELNARIKFQENRLNQLIEKYQIDEQLLENTNLTEFLTNCSNKIDKTAENVELSLTKVTEALLRVETQEQELENTNARIQQIEVNQPTILEGLNQLTTILGNQDIENSVIGQLAKIEDLKGEFSENIQNINMAIGSNIPGAETGIHRLLKEAKISKDIYYSYTISADQFENYKILQIKLPEYISAKGNYFIVRAKNNLQLFETIYDINEKVLSINLENYQRSQDSVQIIILPILIEEIQLQEPIIGIRREDL